MKETSHGIRTEPRGTHRAPGRRRDRQPPHQRRARRQHLGGHRRVVHQQADRRAGRQDRVAPHRHLPGRAHLDAREAREEGPAGLHRRQAPDAALVEARRGRRPVLDRDSPRARRARSVPGQAERERRRDARGPGARVRLGDAGRRRPGVRRTTSTTTSPSSRRGHAPPPSHLGAGASASAPFSCRRLRVLPRRSPCGASKRAVPPDRRESMARDTSIFARGRSSSPTSSPRPRRRASSFASARRHG